MVSINTNLSSLIVQGNLTSATTGLNKAIERLSTGYKINHASDNAANYSIANTYESKLSSYEVAASNVQSGLDLLSVAQDTISTMQNHGARLQALITQARNGTYGAQSLSAMTQEAGALISEIQRMYTNTEYNGINLFDNLLPEWAKTVREEAGLVSDLTPKYNGFISNPQTYTEQEVSEMTRVSDTDTFVAGRKYSIYTAEELQKIATKVNNREVPVGSEFVLGNDIDLSSIENWTPIGNSTNSFSSTFNGNGHVIKNVKIDSNDSYQGVFGYAFDHGTIKNLCVKNVSIQGKNHCGALVGITYGSVDNCYSEDCLVKGSSGIGGLVGQVCRGTISQSWANTEVINTGSSSSSGAGGLVGYVYTGSTIRNSFAKGNVNGKNKVGGLAGEVSGTPSRISNCYAIGDVRSSKESTGGLVGTFSKGTLEHCYALGDVYSDSYYTGGLAGSIANEVSVNACYATGNVTSKSHSAGGLVGWSNAEIKDSYSTSNVTGTTNIGGLIGGATNSVQNSFAQGNVTSSSGFCGGLIGKVQKTSDSLDINTVFASGNIKCASNSGSLIGGIANTADGTSFAEINIINASLISQDIDIIGGTYSTTAGNPEVEYDMTDWLNNIKLKQSQTTLQVGVNSDESSQISFGSGFNYDLDMILHDIKGDKAYTAITNFMSTLSAKATELGSISNRLESSLESIAVNMQNLGDSLSTVKDVDMAKVSSEYIKKQILQQASATLLATANQSPAIALQLI